MTGTARWIHATHGTRRRLVPALALVVLALTLTFHSAAAGLAWCKSDPIVRVGGKVANIYVSAPQDIFAVATGPTVVVVTVPAGVSAEVLMTDGGFGHGEVVYFRWSPSLVVSNGQVPIAVAVLAPSAGAPLPVLVEITSASGYEASAYGSTNTWIGAWASL